MDNDKPDTGGGSAPKTGFLETADRWKQYLVAVAAILTVAAQLWSIVENQWRLASVTLILAVAVVALYVVSHRFPLKNGRAAKALRVAMILVLILIPVCSLAGLFAYSYLPRLTEGETTTIAVAEFSAPPATETLKECRPSDMLVHALNKVGARYGGIRAFELPYSIDPDNRWATDWAEFHGWFEGADMTVYGEYLPYQSGTGVPNGQSDEVVINPEVTRIPVIPLGFLSAPLYGWTFTGSVANIHELCGSDLRDAGKAPRFLDDARRIASAIAGLRALGHNDLETAQQADEEAHRSEIDQLQKCRVDPAKKSEAVKIESDSLCPPVLAFYLATLDTRLGHLPSAIGEYVYASPKLGTPSGYINLGELYLRVNDETDAIKAFSDAVDVDPTSVAAWAARSEAERDYLHSQEAWIDLQRAMKLRRVHYQGPFDDLSLSYAVYQRGNDYRSYANDTGCGIAALQKVLYPDWPVDKRPVKGAGIDALVRYGSWLMGALNYSDAIDTLQAALKDSPDSVHANYAIGISYEKAKPPNLAEAETYLRRAEFATAYTDEDYLYRANAAHELSQNFDQGDAIDGKADRGRAMDAYAQSIKNNPGAVYAYYGRAILERPNDVEKARADLYTAATLHRDDPMIQSAYGQILDSIGRKTEGAKYDAQAIFALANRISSKETKDWDPQACGYRNPDD